DYRAALMVRADHLEITTVDAQNSEVYQGEVYQGLDAGDDRVQPLVTVAFRKRPLDEALDELAEHSGLNIVLDAVNVKDRAKTPITARFMNTPIDTAIRLTTKMADLSVYEIDNVIFVTTP